MADGHDAGDEEENSQSIGTILNEFKIDNLGNPDEGEGKFCQLTIIMYMTKKK